MINDTFNNFSGELIPLIKTNNDNLSQVVSQIQSNNQLLQDIKTGFFGSGDSGDVILGGTTIASGDEPTLEDLPVIEIAPEDDPSDEFFSWLLFQITYVLEDDEEQTLIIPIYGTDYTIRSDIYKLDIEPLRTFIQAGWWFIVGVPFLKYIRRCIEKLKGGEIPASDEKSDLLGNVL